MSTVPQLVLSPAALQEILPEVQDALRVVAGGPVQKVLAEAVARRIVRAYASAHRRHRPLNRRIAPGTREIMTMEVGDTIEQLASAYPTLLSRFRTARNAMDCPDAGWTVQLVEPGRYRITRRPDGSRPAHDPRKNPKAVELAAIALNGVKTSVTCRTVHDIAASTKAQARKILNDDKADWRASTTREGRVQLRRTA